MGNNKNDMIGKKFNRLMVIEECKERDKNRNKVYKCICDCGNITYVKGTNLRSGHTKSCGCYHNDISKKRIIKLSTKHGKSNTKLYNIWQGIKQRCCYTKHISYKDYGGRGITVCDTWLHDFDVFYDWAKSSGYKDGLTIDRIDVNGNYEPNNCRWVTRKQQNLNTRQNVYLTYNGKTQTMKEWSDELCVNYNTLRTRHRNGYDDKECLFGKDD